MAKIFISHSSRDAEQAEQMKAWLHQKGFAETFLDFDKHAGIPPGANWEKELYSKIEQSEAMIVIATPNWLDSKWCFAEFTQARALGKPIFPIIYTPLGDRLVSPDIHHLNLLSDGEGGLERLSLALRQIAIDAQGGFAWDPNRQPYPGLMHFTEEDAAIYFGRDDEIRRLIERLNARRAQGGKKLIALLGASGSGKSSLLRAGVLPRLRRDAAHWLIVPPFRPQKRPIQEMAMVLAIALDNRDRWRELAQQLQGDGASAVLGDLANDLRMKSASNTAQILLPIDQAEELFTMADRDEAQCFMRLLSAALADDSPYLVVMTIRSSMLDQLQSETSLTAPFEEFSLKPMPLSHRQEIIEKPARIAGLKVEERLVTQAMQDSSTEDALPLLAFALRALYERFGHDGDLTYAQYVSLGDAEYQASGDGKSGLNPVENAIRRRADEVIADIGASQKDLDALRDAFSPALVHIDDKGEYARQTAPLSKLPSAALPLIEKLINARLLVEHAEGGERMIEVTHESLLRKWPLLRGWLDEERDFLAGIQRLEQDLRDWEAAPADQKSAALLAGLKLARARTWIMERPHKLGARQREFIDASIARADQEQIAEAERIEREKKSIRRTRWLQRVASALLVVIMMAAAWLSYTAAKRESQLFASKANDAFEQGYCDRAVRYAVAGLPLRAALSVAIWSPDAEIALKKAALDCRLVQVLTGHSSDVIWVAISPDDTRIVTASEDGTARLWNARDGSLIRSLPHDSSVRRAAFDPSGRLVVTASEDRTARIWDTATGERKPDLKHKGIVYTAYFDPQGRRVVTAAEDGTVRIWDVESGTMLRELAGHGGPVTFAFFTSSGAQVVSGSNDNTARIWDAESGREIVKLEGHTGPLRDAVVSPDGRQLVTASDDKTARILGRRTGAAGPVLAKHGAEVVKVVFDHRGELIATASADKTVRLWDARTGAEGRVLVGHTGHVPSVAFLPGDDRVVTASHDRTIQIWDVKSGRSVAILHGHEAPPEALAVSHDGRFIATASHDKTARMWDANEGRSGHILGSFLSASETFALDADSTRVAIGSSDGSVRLFTLPDLREGPILRGHDQAVTGIAFSSDGRVLATSSYDGTVKLWDGKTYELLRTLKDHTGVVQSVTLSRNGGLVLSGSHDTTARLWRARDGSPGPVLLHDSLVYSAVFSPDGKMIATASWDKKGRLWDTETGRLLRTLEGHSERLWSIAFSPDGKLLVTASDDKTARIWDARSGGQIAVLKGHESALASAVFSSDGRFVFTTSDDKTARFWRASDGAELAVLRGHSGDVQYGALNSDATRAITASRDNTARLWDLRTGTMISVLRGHTGEVAMASFTKGDKSVITVSQDGTARIWDVDYPPPPTTTALRELVCHVLFAGAREFTHHEMVDPLLWGRSNLKAPCERGSFFGFDAIMSGH